jgi:hypothetical protein
MEKTVKDLIHDELPQEDRNILAEDRKRWQRMGAGAHLSDWMAYAPGLYIRRRLAMKINHTNRPQGRGYVETYSQLLRHDGFDTTDKALMNNLTSVAWLNDAPERVRVLREITETMTPGERARLNSPVTARQRVEKIIKARGDGTEERIRTSPVAVLKEANVKLEHEVEDLKEKLAAAETRDGSLFDLKRDTIDAIAETITKTISEDRFNKIAAACKKRFKAPHPAG